MLDIGIEPYLVASSLIGVIAQRLVRIICKECNEEFTPDGDVLGAVHELKLKISDFPGGKLHRGRGCEACFNTGYAGRTAIYEILKVTDDIRQLVVDRASATVIKQTALRRGLITLRGDGISKVKSGQTTVDEVLRVTQLDIE
jgi:type II secretory ATPase GspE/PulE/Tfp pilus assembly ATPase PilB-like protein